MDAVEVLLIGGRAGVGKTTVGWEVSARLRTASIAHAVIEGDFLAQVHPPPPDDPRRSQLAESNLRAMWANYIRLGYRRLIYTNTVSVLPETTAMFHRVMGDDVRLTGVLLTASDHTITQRLTAREIGSELAHELRNSARKARLLDAETPSDTVRIPTDDRPITDIAHQIVTLTGWTN
ncbi:MAG TPA: hypothetical protein VHJ17_14835 [Thermomonospora sp.]|nr:hypothetical protein [Thermomonospora sp.]